MMLEYRYNRISGLHYQIAQSVFWRTYQANQNSPQEILLMLNATQTPSEGGPSTFPPPSPSSGPSSSGLQTPSSSVVTFWCSDDCLGPASTSYPPLTHTNIHFAACHPSLTDRYFPHSTVYLTCCLIFPNSGATSGITEDVASASGTQPICSKP